MTIAHDLPNIDPDKLHSIDIEALTDRYSERKESADALSLRVNQRAI